MLDQFALDAALAPARRAARWGIALGVAVALIGLASSGIPAAVAGALGCSAGLLAGRSLVGLLASALAAGDAEAARRGRRRAVIAALLRYPLLGAALALGLMAFELPASWLAAGLTAWPLSLVASALASPGAAPVPES